MYRANTYLRRFELIRSASDIADSSWKNLVQLYVVAVIDSSIPINVVWACLSYERDFNLFGTDCHMTAEMAAEM